MPPELTGKRVVDPAKMREYRRKWRENNPSWSREYYKKFPWLRTFQGINSRCNNPNEKAYPRYGGRGIKNILTQEDIRFLWFRDGAYLMKCPSIDREDNDGNYTMENCQFIEKHINSGRFRRALTHCKNGHPFNHKRQCQICRNAYGRAYKKQRRITNKNYGR